MKPGKTLLELAQALTDLKQNSKDFLVPTSQLSMTDKNTLAFDGKEFTPNEYSHGQVASYADIPKSYYDRLRSQNGSLLASNVNHGMRVQSESQGRGNRPETRMVRTHKDGIRALLSSSYRRLDSFDMAETVLPILAQSKMEVVSSEITDTRMYLKALSPRITAEIKKGDMVQYGLTISNSDVGAGSVRVEPLIYRLVCSNGMISNTSIKKYHVGRNMAGDDITQLLSNETLNLTDQAFWAQIKDILLASMRPENFEIEVNRLRAAAEQKITNFDLTTVVELSMKAVSISGEEVKDSIVSYLANGADGAGLTKWGLANAFTYAAHKVDMGYDKSIELERAGSKIIDLSGNSWKRVAEVA